MIQNLLSLREEEIFKTLKALQYCNFVTIGGYAVNAYTLPRFSVDCDIVVRDKEELHKIEKILLSLNYIKRQSSSELPYSGAFLRYEKRIANTFIVSIDVLIQTISDRGTESTFSAVWVFENSSMKKLKGKTITEELKIRIIRLDALLVMKIISCRSSDIRDVFMMLPYVKDKAWVRSEVDKRYDIKERFAKILDTVESKQFRDGLFGVYGSFDQKVFEKHKKAVLGFVMN